jgi:hypothetical protein
MARDQASRRIHQRYACDFPVVLSNATRELAAKAQNVSLGGVFLAVDGADIAARTAFPYGTEAKIRMQVPALKDEVAITVTVRWATQTGIGVQFGSLRAKEVWGLNELFKGLDKAS